MWSQILNESRSTHKFQNRSVLVLGGKHSGKRTLIDGLYEISKTQMSKKTSPQVTRLRDRNLTSVVDYAYLNVSNLNDTDNKTHAKLELLIIDDDDYKQIAQAVASNPDLIQKMIVVIMLDFSTPWNFMSQLNKWVTFARHILARAGLSIGQLDQMKANIEKHFRKYHQPVFDQDGKRVKKTVEPTQKQFDIPLPEGVLINNVRLPLVVCVNKSDLQMSVFQEKGSDKILFVQYHLRKFCQEHGATLIYTSTKNHFNLDLLYQYLLHRAYSFPLRFKSQTLNEEAIFLPLGSDNPQLLNDSIKVAPQSYQLFIPAPVLKKTVKQQIIAEDDTQFFKKYQAEAVRPQRTTAPPTQPATQTPSITATTQPAQPTQKPDARTFFSTLINNPPDHRRQSALDSLAKHTKDRPGDKSDKLQKNGSD